MLEQVQIIKDNGKSKFAVIPFEEYLHIKELLSDTAKLEDYLDYLHIQQVKGRTRQKFSLEQVRHELAAERAAVEVT